MAEIAAERDRQRDKWRGPHRWGQGDCSSRAVTPIVKVAVLGEEYGEVARAVLEHDDAALRRELVQVAAVAVAWLESFE
jgi:NTP pyrophosphatase (non-canonical NTP hydrolase)